MQSLPRLCALILFGLLASGADAQVLLHGRVVDFSSAEPVIGANIVLETSAGTVLSRRITDDTGSFSFIARGPGPFHLRVDRIGYQQARAGGFSLRGGTEPEITIRMTPAPIAIPGVEVRADARSASPSLAGFHQRRASSIGWFRTREDIERDRPNRVSSLIAMAPGVRIQRGIIYMARGVSCPAQIVIDGFHINRPAGAMPGRRGASTTEMFPIDELVRPEAIEGIEVYQGLSSVPPELRAGSPACGLVAIWTRRGG
jgi:hypothetical protein